MMAGYTQRSAGYWAVALMILMSMLIATPVAVAEEADGSTGDENAPMVIIEMDENVKTSKVEPGMSGLVIFTGIVEVWNFGDWEAIENTSLELEATSGTGYSTAVRPKYWNESYGMTPITVSVRVPPATPASTVDTVTIGGVITDMRTGSREKITEEHVSVLVQQYHRFEVTLEEEYIKTRGGLEDYYMSIENQGNGPDTFDIELDNMEDLKEQDLTVALSTTSVLIDAGETETVRIGVANGDDTENFQLYPVAIGVISQGSRAEGLKLEEQVFIYYQLSDHWLGPEGFAGLIAFIILLMVLVVFVVRRRRRWMVKFHLVNRRGE